MTQTANIGAIPAAWAAATLQAAPGALVSLDAQRRVVGWNDLASELTGRPADEMLGESFDLVVPDHLRSRFHEGFKRYFEERRRPPSAFEGRILHADGRIVPVEATVARAEVHGEARLVMFIRDVSARTAARRRAQALLDHHELLLRSLDVVVISLDLECRVERWNRAAERVLGLEEPMAVGRRLDQLPLDWPKERVREALEEVCLGSTARIDDLPFRSAAGDPRVLGLKIAPLFSEGARTGGLLTGADITDRRALETQLHRAERLESIGQLAAGIAHEINTPIQFVGDNLRFLDDSMKDLVRLLDETKERLEARGGDPTGALAALEEELEPDFLREEIPRALEQSLDGVRRVARIVRAMKELSHPPTKEMAGADLNRAVESTTIISKNEWKYSAQLELDLDPGLPLVTCMVNELSQVFLNLIINAAHAISARYGQDNDRGRIRVSTRKMDRHVEVRVADNGTGMDDEVRARCFDPFFTTKGVGRGTGQGLAITHAIVVDQHGGSLDLETAPGEGTTMILRIPLEPELEDLE